MQTEENEEIEQKLLFMVQQNEKLVELVNEITSESNRWKSQYEQLQQYHKNYMKEMKQQLDSKNCFDEQQEYTYQIEKLQQKVIPQFQSNEYKQDCEKMQEIIQNLEDYVKQLTQEHQNLQIQIQQAQKDIKHKDEYLQIEKQKNNEFKKSCEVRILGTQKTVDELGNLIQLEQKCNKNALQLEQKNMLVDQMKQTILAQEKDIMVLKDKLYKQGHELQQTYQQKQILEMQVHTQSETLQQQLDEIVQLRQLLIFRKQEQQKHLNEIFLLKQNFQNEKNQLDIKINQLENQFGTLNEILEQDQIEIQQYKKENSLLKQDKIQLIQDVQHLLQNNQNLLKNYDGVQSDLNSLQVKYQNSTNKNNTILSDLTLFQDNNNKLQMNIQESRDMIKQLQQKIQEQDSENQKLINQNQQLMHEKNRNLAQLEQIQQKLQTQHQQIQYLDQQTKVKTIEFQKDMENLRLENEQQTTSLEINYKNVKFIFQIINERENEIRRLKSNQERLQNKQQFIPQDMSSANKWPQSGYFHQNFMSHDMQTQQILKENDEMNNKIIKRCQELLQNY